MHGCLAAEYSSLDPVCVVWRLLHNNFASLTTDWLTLQRFPADPGAFIDPVPFSQFLSAGDEYRRPGQPGLWLPERPGILQQDLPDCEDVHKDQVSSSQLMPSLRTSLRGVCVCVCLLPTANHRKNQPINYLHTYTDYHIDIDIMKLIL